MTAARLPDVVRAFITQARDKYGLARFYPDELPLLDEMARLCREENDAHARADEALELLDALAKGRYDPECDCCREAARLLGGEAAPPTEPSFVGKTGDEPTEEASNLGGTA